MVANQKDKRANKFTYVDDFQEFDLVGGDLYKVRVRDITCGWDHSMVTTMSGLLFTWGLNVYGELGIGNYKDQDKPQHVEALQFYDVVNMSAGKHHSAAITKCGKLFMWGQNPDGRLLKKREFYKNNAQTKNYLLPFEILPDFLGKHSQRKLFT